MKTKENCAGIDYFRIPAALLVVAIHTSPLSGWSGEADFFLTRVLARIAVPFFFMTAGRFVLSDYCRGRSFERVRRYLWKILILYGVSICLYLPVGIYAGHYERLTVWSVCRMLFFDGTFYHLWYFPACVIGMGTACLLIRLWGLGGALRAAGALYGLGLLGDSYYGVTQTIPILSTIYEMGFRIWSYTRNGLFMAPVFLLLGAMWGSGAEGSRRRGWVFVTGFLCSFGLMTAEAFILRRFHVSRHDSMYVWLVPTAFCLYGILERVPDGGKSGESRESGENRENGRMLRGISTGIYILHPAAIVLVRGLARFVGWEILVTDNFVHYWSVAAVSVTAAWTATAGLRWIRKLWERGADTGAGRCRSASKSAWQRIGGRRLRDMGTDSGRAWIEIDREALRNNVAFFRSRLPRHCELMAVVKADAYGHGSRIVAGELQRMGVRAWCVACVQEGIALRRAGIRGEILVLGYTHPMWLDALRRYRLSQTVVDAAYGEVLRQYGRRIHVHVGIDTGMHRLGERCEHTEEICRIFAIPNLIVDGVFTHLAADESTQEEEQVFTKRQAKRLEEVLEILEQRGVRRPKVHLQASGGVLNYPELAGDYARVGIALYGVLGTAQDTRRWADSLRPVLSFKCRVASIKEIYAGESVGYGLDCTAEDTLRIAVLTVGYADGLPRALSDAKGAVLIRGKRAPIIGKICMDQTIVDVSGIEHVKPGDVAVVIGRSGEEEITVCDIAGWAGTIANEILSRLGKRPMRMPDDSGAG